MSKQTNDFQKLVKLVQKALASSGAVVEESVMVNNQGHEREIDVLIQDTMGPYKIKIAVEVKDHSRPLGPQVVEEYIGKYRQGDGIPVNQVVIVSSNGFTRSARDKARNANIKLLTLKEATTADWKKFIPPGKVQRLRFQIAPHYHRILFFPIPPVDLTQIMQQGRIVCECCGRDHGLVSEMIRDSVKKYLIDDPARRTQLRAALKEHNGHALATLNASFDNRVIVVGDAQFPMRMAIVEVHFCEAETDMKVTTYQQADADGSVITLQHATAEVMGKKIDMVLPDGIQSKKIVVDISNASDVACEKNARQTQRHNKRRAG